MAEPDADIAEAADDGEEMLDTDPQSLANALALLEEDDAIGVINQLLVERPELAPPIVNFAVPDLCYPPTRSLAERRAKGNIKMYNEDKGFGFISCRELHNIFGNDVFVHGKQLKGMQPGTEVNFCVLLNKDNKPQAFDVLEDKSGVSSGNTKSAKGGSKGDWSKSVDWGKSTQPKGKGKDVGSTWSSRDGPYSSWSVANSWDASNTWSSGKGAWDTSDGWASGGGGGGGGKAW